MENHTDEIVARRRGQGHQMPGRACMLWALIALASVAPGCHATRADAAAPPVPESIRHSRSQADVRARAIAPGEAQKPSGPAFAYEYDAPKSPALQAIYARVLEADLLHNLPEVQAIDGMFQLPRRLRYITAECGEFGAFYRPDSAEIVLCYETLTTLYERGEAQQGSGTGADYPLRYTRANARFIVLHETGHALVDLLDLPVTGRQEDAVDQLAAILMLRFAGLDETPAQTIENLRLAAQGMLARSTGAYDLYAYADEHALGEQRYFNLQCLIFGTDPIKYAGMVSARELTPARAKVCQRETRAVSRAWLRLLLPHLAPKYEMTGTD